MKCAACGYEKRNDYYVIDEVVYYRSGKRKGQIKEVRQKTIEPDQYKADFRPLLFSKDVDQLMFDPRDRDRFGPHTPSVSYIEADLYACPECGTVQVANIY